MIVGLEVHFYRTWEAVASLSRRKFSHTPFSLSVWHGFTPLYIRVQSMRPGLGSTAAQLRDGIPFVVALWETAGYIKLEGQN